MNAVDAAAFLGVHVETLRKLARRNDIPSFKVGRDWRFSEEALMRWANEQRSQSASPVSECSVLVLDDEEKVCRALSRHVERMGCRARHATSGERGLELIATEVPDLVLLDLKMPGMSGPEFLEQLRKDHPALPVVIVTGYPDSDLMHQATRFPPLMLLPKPVHQDHIEKTVRIVLGERVTTLRTG